MLTWIKKFFEPPVFHNQARTRQAYLATQVAIALLFFAVMVMASALVSRVYVVDTGVALSSVAVWVRLLSALAFVALGAYAQLLVRRGQVHVASVLLTLSLTLIFTVMLVVSRNGIRTPFFSIYLIIIFIAAVLLGRNWGMGLAVFTGVLAVVLTFSEMAFRKTPLVLSETPLTMFFMNVGIMVMMVTLFYVAVGNMNRSLNEARLANRQLEALRMSLEQRVEERTHALSRRARYLEAATDVARYISSEWELEELLARLVTLISERFSFYHAGIFLVNASGEWAELQAASSQGGQQMLARGHRLQVGQVGTVGYVTAYGEARIALDVGADAVFFNNPDLPDTRSAITLPLRSRRRIIGALDVQSTESAAFTDEDVMVLQALADQVALAISNVRLFERLQDSVAAERRAYGELSYRAWAEMLHARGVMGYVDDASGTYPVSAIVASDGLTDSDVENVLQSDTDTVAIPVKLREGGGVLGVVRLRKSQAAGSWTPEQVALMESITEQMGVALESARLYQDSQHVAMRERLVGKSARRMRQNLDVESVLKTAVDEIYNALELEEVTVRLTSDSDTARADTARADTARADTGVE